MKEESTSDDHVVKEEPMSDDAAHCLRGWGSSPRPQLGWGDEDSQADRTPPAQIGLGHWGIEDQSPTPAQKPLGTRPFRGHRFEMIKTEPGRSGYSNESSELLSAANELPNTAGSHPISHHFGCSSESWFSISYTIFAFPHTMKYQH